MFDVKSDQGVVTGTVNGLYMDAAVVGDLAGLEVSLDRMHAFDEHRETRHAQLQLSLDMTPDVMRQLVVMLAEKTGQPMFTTREWAVIAETLRDIGRRRNGARDLIEYADRIRAGLEV
jgi:3-oxoacyl-(acyl-carrier-protein) synthase